MSLGGEALGKRLLLAEAMSENEAFRLRAMMGGSRKGRVAFLRGEEDEMSNRVNRRRVRKAMTEKT